MDNPCLLRGLKRRASLFNTDRIDHLYQDRHEKDVRFFLHDGDLTDSMEETMNFKVTLDRDEDGIWIVECPAIPGCVSQGMTREDAMDNIREAIQMCLEVRAEQGLPLTMETREVEVRCLQHDK